MSLAATVTLRGNTAASPHVRLISIKAMSKRGESATTRAQAARPSLATTTRTQSSTAWRAVSICPDPSTKNAVPLFSRRMAGASDVGARGTVAERAPSRATHRNITSCHASFAALLKPVCFSHQGRISWRTFCFNLLGFVNRHVAEPPAGPSPLRLIFDQPTLLHARHGQVSNAAPGASRTVSVPAREPRLGTDAREHSGSAPP